MGDFDLFAVESVYKQKKGVDCRSVQNDNQHPKKAKVTDGQRPPPRMDGLRRRYSPLVARPFWAGRPLLRVIFAFLPKKYVFRGQWLLRNTMFTQLFADPTHPATHRPHS